MIYETPSKENMLEAMELTGVNQAYFVLPGYWSRFQIITEAALPEANAAYNLNDKIYIFKYFR